MMSMSKKAEQTLEALNILSLSALLPSSSQRQNVGILGIALLLRMGMGSLRFAKDYGHEAWRNPIGKK
jgi:hypothetical protein